MRWNRLHHSRRQFLMTTLAGLGIQQTAQPQGQPRFLTLPFADERVRVQQGWRYTFENTSMCAHRGIDYMTGQQQSFEVLASTDGWAELKSLKELGNTIIVKTSVNGENWFTVYAHLHDRTKLEQSFPRSVSRGDLIGWAGKTGTKSNNVLHLHFELSRYGSLQDVCTGVNPHCGSSCRLDPYGLYDFRQKYPVPGSTVPVTSYFLPPTQLIVNGGFEYGSSGWSIPADGNPPGWVSPYWRHSGVNSLLLGGSDLWGREPKGVSVAYQKVSVPYDAGLGSVSFFYWPWSNDSADRQEVHLEDYPAGGFRVVKMLMEANENHQSWQEKVYPIDWRPYRGKQIGLAFLVRQNGNGRATGMLVDDVKLVYTPTSRASAPGPRP